VTGLGRAAERAAKRKRRRDRIRMSIAGVCVVAGLALFAVVEGSSGGSAATRHPDASARHSDQAAPAQSTSASSPAPGSSQRTQTAQASQARLPIVGTASPTDPGQAVFTSPDVVTAVLTAAKAGVEEIDSYDYRHLDDAIQSGLSVTTGAFQTSYRAAMTGAVAGEAPTSQTVQRCIVQKLGITSISSNGQRASTLVFGELQTSDTSTGTTPHTTAITLGVTLDQVAGTWLISAVSDFSTGSGKAQPPGTGALVAASLAGAQEVVNLLSFRRADYDADFARALAGLTGPLLAEQQGQKSSILAAMTAAKVDYTGDVRCIGIESASGDSVIMLVAASSYEVAPDGTRTLQTLPKLEIGVVRVQGRWLVDQFQAVGSA
jgi:Mce-associated membrane protein